MNTNKEIKEKNKVIAVKLVRENMYTMTNIPYRFKGKTIKEGMLVTLKDDERVWVVKSI